MNLHVVNETMKATCQLYTRKRAIALTSSPVSVLKYSFTFDEVNKVCKTTDLLR